MSHAGLTVTSDSGSLQIDESYLNFSLVARGSINLAVFDQASNSIPAGNTLSISGLTAPSLFFLDGSVFTAVVGKQVSGSTHSWLLACGTAGVCNYVVFDVKVPNPSTYGLQVFGPAGDLIFDARSQVMRFVGTYATGSWTGTITLPAGRTYAVACNQTLIRFSGFRQGGNIYTACIANSLQIAGNIITLGGARYRTIPTDPSNFQIDTDFYNANQPSALQFVVIDVTDF